MAFGVCSWAHSRALPVRGPYRRGDVSCLAEIGRVRAYAVKPSLPVGPDRLTVGADRVAAAPTGRDGPARDAPPPRHRRRDLVCGAVRRFVAAATSRLS